MLIKAGLKETTKLTKTSKRKLEYMAEYQKRPENVKKRVARNKARRLMIRKHGAAALKGKDVDHKDGNPSHNTESNLRIMSRKRNRGRNNNKHKQGGMKRAIAAKSKL